MTRLCPETVAHRPTLMKLRRSIIFTSGHSQLKTGHPVRSAIHKQLNGRLVLRWVTTWESLLLYVLFCWKLTRAAMDCSDTPRKTSVSIPNLPGSG
jgi:hypothetical protein